MFKLEEKNGKVIAKVSIPHDEWEAQVEKVYQQNKSRFVVLGFRKGHVPRKVVEKEYGEGVFFEDTLNFFYDEVINEILKDHPEYEPTQKPNLSLESFDASKGLNFTIEINVVPEFKVCEYKGLEIGIHKGAATVEKEINLMLEQNAEYVDVDRASQNKDVVLIDFDGFIDEKSFEGGSAKNYKLELGSNTFIPGFEDQLIGHKEGETVNVNVKFPEDYHASEFASKNAVFVVKINKVREKRLPTLDDKFISNTTEFETVEEYKKHVNEHIQTMNQNDQDNEFQYNLKKYLTAHTEIKIPDEMVETYVEYNLSSLREIAGRYGLTVDQYLQMTGQGNLEERMEEIKKDTLESIKFRYIIRKLIKENNIVVSEEEMKTIDSQSKNEDEKYMELNRVLRNKAIEFIKSKCKIVTLADDKEFDWKKKQSV